MSRILRFLFIVANSYAYAQSEDIKAIVREGIILHDSGRYGDALLKYKEALQLDPASSLVNYEIALTYYTLKNYEEAIKFAEDAIAQKDDNELGGIIIKGSALDDRGDVKESVDFYKKALQRYPNAYLLLYNYAVSCGRINLVAEAEQALIRGISNNVGHPGSHLKLAYLKQDNDGRIQAMLGLYFFLMLENNTERAREAYENLTSLFYRGVSRDADNPKNITVNIGMPGKDGSGMSELSLSLIAASSLEKHKDKNEFERLAADTHSFFQIVGELNQNKAKKKSKKSKKDDFDLWHDYYADFFYNVSQAGLTEAFCYHISLASGNETPKTWVELNPDKVELFYLWLQNQ
jgi:tetratricopeptide (TPR) repeat protein